MCAKINKKENIFDIREKYKKYANLCPDLFIEDVYTMDIVPLHDKNRYVTFFEYPFDTSNCGLESKFKLNNEVGIVIQGPVIEKDDFTLNTIKLYMKNMSGAHIILSTWDDISETFIRKIKALNVDVICSSLPQNRGRGNVNLQIKSTMVGIVRAKELGMKYIMKTRTDQRIYKSDVIEYLLNLQKLFPLQGDGVKLNQRIISTSYDSFKYRFYGVSDMFMFGEIEDMIKYWDYGEDYFISQMLSGMSDEQIFQEMCSETILAKNFLSKIGYNIKNTLEDSLNVYKQFFCFVDKEMIGLFWPKYTNQYSRWQWYDDKNLLEEMTFLQWLNILNKSHVECRSDINEMKWRRPAESPNEFVNSSNPKVSVLLPVYNTKEEYLRECINSILNQSYTNFELIIVNDGSTDKNVDAIIRQYKDGRIRYYNNEKNLGISGVRNLLIDLAKGEYLAIMDHDDICMKDRFQKQVDFLDEHKDYGLVGSWHGFVGSDVIFERYIDNFDIKRNMLWDCTMHHPTTMIRRNLFLKYNIRYREEYSPCEDYSLWLDLLDKTKFYNIPEPLFIYRNNYNNTTNSDLKLIDQRIREIWEHYRNKYSARYLYYRILRFIAKKIKITHFRTIWLFFKRRIFV